MLIGWYSYKNCWIAAEEASENKENVGFLLSCQKNHFWLIWLSNNFFNTKYSNPWNIAYLSINFEDFSDFIIKKCYNSCD